MGSRRAMQAPPQASPSQLLPTMSSGGSQTTWTLRRTQMLVQVRQSPLVLHKQPLDCMGMHLQPTALTQRFGHCVRLSTTGNMWMMKRQMLRMLLLCRAGDFCRPKPSKRPAGAAPRAPKCCCRAAACGPATLVTSPCWHYNTQTGSTVCSPACSPACCTACRTDCGTGCAEQAAWSIPKQGPEQCC